MWRFKKKTKRITAIGRKNEMKRYTRYGIRWNQKSTVWTLTPGQLVLLRVPSHLRLANENRPSQKKTLFGVGERPLVASVLNQSRAGTSPVDNVPSRPKAT